MRRPILISMLVLLAAGLSFAAQSATRGFGFGGGFAMAFFPDMTEINTFLSENGLGPMPDLLIGAGGGGRGGIVGGPALGGLGWGVFAESRGTDRHAELLFGGGGFDLGAALGGDERSVLTLGAVFGGGATVLTVSMYPVPSEGLSPHGIVPEPTSREIGCAVGFVQPYVSLAAELLPWMGLELRLGYVLPVFGIAFDDLVGIPGPTVSLSGPTVSLGAVFGGIEALYGEEGLGSDPRAARGQTTRLEQGAFSLAAGSELVIENRVGDVTILSVPSGGQPTELAAVAWEVEKTASVPRIDALQVESSVHELVGTLRSVGAGRINYVVRVPAGVDVRIENGTGDVTVLGYEAMTIVVENGVGDVLLQEVRAAALIVASGVGRIDMPHVEAQMLIATLGIGDIALALPVAASTWVSAKAGLGNVTIDRFPTMVGGVRGFLGESADVTLGHGAGRVELKVGIGSIDVRMRIP